MTHHAWLRFGSGTLLLTALALAVACSGTTVEEEGSGKQATSKGKPSSSSSSSSGDVDGCGPEAVDQTDDCEVCIATQCTAAATACCEQPGCLDVVRCAAEMACNGIECYAPDKCQAEIDAAGIDVAMNYAQPLGDCAIASCPTECEDMVGG